MRKKISLAILFITTYLLNSVIAFSAPTVYTTGTTIYNQQKTFEGYTLYTAEGLNKTILVNMAGQIVREWIPPAGMNFGYAEPLSNGNILVFAKIINQSAGNHSLIEYDWDNNIIWEYKSKNMHHDFERLENGNTLILCADLRVVPEISPLTIRDDYIIEVDPAGQIVWEWHTYEHFNEFGFSAEAKQLISEKGGDWAHTNSIQSLPDNLLGDSRFKKGNILVSQRNTNIMYIIDKDTGQIVWKIGPDDNLTIGQHNPTLLPLDLPSAGNILVFDNGGEAGYPNQYRFFSMVVEIEPINKRITAKYTATRSGLNALTFFSVGISGSQRLPNGNTLIDEGAWGRIFEITPTGEIVWEYINPYVNDIENVQRRNVYRAWRVDLNWIPAIQ